MFGLTRNPFGFAITATLAILACGSNAGSGHGQEPLIRILQVSTRGIDLASPSGQALLRHRIAVAARKVCGAFDESPSSLSSDYRDCSDNAVAGAMQQAQARIDQALIANNQSRERQLIAQAAR